MKYKAGDRVKAKSLNWYNENKNKVGRVWTSGRQVPFEKHMSKWCGKVMTISDVRADHYTMIEDLVGYWTDEMIEGLVEELLDNDMEEHQKIVDEIMAIQGIEPIEAEIEEVWHCPEGYIFKDENGNVINATKIVLEKKKKEYPKTFDKCCHVVQTAFVCDVRLHKGKYYDIFRALAKLIVCRDAYWKIAGEEMGLGKPWVPSKSDTIFGISRIGDIIERFDDVLGKSHILEFPTEEMRDAFYENFKSEIESCKELL